MTRERATRVQWLTEDDVDLARATFVMMRDVFAEAGVEEDVDVDVDADADAVVDSSSDDGRGGLSDAYVRRLLSDPSFWALAAIDPHGEPVGGVTAHVLPMTRSESREVFIYDLAVRPDRQRQGIARALIAAVVERADEQGMVAVFVPADNDDTHALAFYEAIGGRASPVTMFDLGRE